MEPQITQLEVLALMSAAMMTLKSSSAMDGIESKSGPDRKNDTVNAVISGEQMGFANVQMG